MFVVILNMEIDSIPLPDNIGMNMINNKIKELKQTWLSYKDLYESTHKEEYKNAMDAAYAVYLKQLEISANQMREEYNIEYAI